MACEQGTRDLSSSSVSRTCNFGKFPPFFRVERGTDLLCVCSVCAHGQAWSVAKRSEGSRGQHIAYSFGTPEEASRMRELGWNADYLMHSAYNHEQLDVATCKVDGQTFPIRTLFDLLDGHYPELGEILSNAQTHNQASEWISLHLVAPHARGFVIDGSLHLLHVEVIAVKPDWDSLSFGGKLVEATCSILQLTFAP